ncbi:hypothetical protein niasHS_006106 [Heterodera schachtii]|uniref:Secretory protein n=1 Tax=Heterodera schachtii TaxID=97005 RepID=A0ABD2JW10_HETSC
MAAISALLLLLPLLLNVQKIPDECVRSDMDAVNSAILALNPWKSPAEIMAQISSQLSIAQAALLIKMNWECLETNNQNGMEAKAPEQFDLALFAEALEATVEMDDGGKEVKLRKDKLNQWATKTGGKAEKVGDKAEKEGDKAEKEGDKVDKVRDKVEEVRDKAGKEGGKAEKEKDKAEKEGDKAEKEEDKAEKDGDKVEEVIDKAEQEGDKTEKEGGKAEKARYKAEKETPKGGKETKTFTKAEENGDKEEKKDPGGEVRMELRRRKDENGNEEVVVTFVKRKEGNDGPAKVEEKEEEEEEEKELSKEEMVPKLVMENGIGANSAVPMEPKFDMMTNSSSTSNNGGTDLAKPVDFANDTGAKPSMPMVPKLDMINSGANLANPVVPKLDMENGIGANSAVPMVPELGMMTNRSSTSNNDGTKLAKPVDMASDNSAKPAVPMVSKLNMINSGANLAKPVVPKVKIANNTSANKPSMPIMIPDIFLHSLSGKLPAKKEAAHERRKMLKKSLYNILHGRHKRETVGMENEAENVANAEDKQQQIIVNIEKLTTLAMMGDGLGFLTKVINLEIVVAKGGKKERPAVPPSDATAPNWTVERDGTENERTNRVVDQNGIENGEPKWTVGQVGTENEETNGKVEQTGTENEKSNRMVERVGTENGFAEMEMESHESPKNLPIENSDGNWEKKAAIKAYLEHGIANANGHKKWEKLAMVWYSELLYWTAKWIEALKNRMAEAKPELASTFIFSNTGLAAFEELKNEVTKCVTKLIKLRKWIGNADKK